MKDRVVCLKSEWTSLKAINYPSHPIKGEIYTITNIDPNGYLEFFEFPEYKGNTPIYNPKFFRPVDDSFGSWVEETIMKEAELETVLI